MNFENYNSGPTNGLNHGQGTYYFVWYADLSPTQTDSTPWTGDQDVYLIYLAEQKPFHYCFQTMFWSKYAEKSTQNSIVKALPSWTWHL